MAIAVVVLGSAPSAVAAPYPTNKCVSAKLKGAAKYCGAVLKAWSAWDKNQDDGKRDAKIAKADDKLAAAWAKAEEKVADKGVDCADTTISAEDLGALVGTTAAQIVAAINDGLDLNEKAHAKCGSKLIKLAAKKCQAFLKAEAKLIGKLDKPGAAANRDAAQTKASAKFSEGWAKAASANCPTTATETGIEDAVDALSDGVVFEITASPNVDDQQFITISPVGPITYRDRSLTPVCMEGSPYHFFAKRGTVNKLVMYYQGGGACWEQLTCAVPVCDDSVNPAGSDNPNNASSGFFDLDNPANPFKDWHIVVVSYCSCDIHFGDAAQDYTNINPAEPLHVEHRGYHNSQIAEKWAREHFVNPEVVFVTGTSAGAYGAWFNAPLLHSVWPASQFHVLADAGNGVITQEFLEDFFPNWNFVANLPPDIPGLEEVLLNGSGIPGYTEVVAGVFPNTTWAHYTTAFDGGSGGQTGFYNVMLNDNNPIAGLTWWNGSCAFNAQMRQQALATAAAVPSNYRYYIGTGSRHGMWGNNKVYTDTTGGVPTILDWVLATLNSSPPMVDAGWTNVECTNCGLLLMNDPQPNPLQPPFQQVGMDVVVTCP